MDLVMALIVALSAVALLGYIATTLWRSFRGNTASGEPSTSIPLMDRWNLFYKRRSVTAFELASKKNPPLELSILIPLFRSSLTLHKVPDALATIEAIDALHTTLMEHLLDMTQRHNLKAVGIPALEELLSIRTALLLERGETLLAERELLKKQREKGRTPPAWATQEFSKKVSLLNERIATNKRAIETSLRDLFAPMSAPSSDVTYH